MFGQFRFSHVCGFDPSSLECTTAIKLIAMEQTKIQDPSRPETLFSPPSDAEALFLGATLDTSDIPTQALLEQFDQTGLRHHSANNSTVSGRIKKSGSFYTAEGSTLEPDEFLSCAEDASDFGSVGSKDESSNSHTFRAFRFYMGKLDDRISTKTSNIMSTILKKTSTKKAPKKVPPVVVEKKPIEVPPPAPTVTKDEGMKIDAAEMVYGKAKDILMWGKSVPVVSFFVGTSEAVAGKALGVVGTDLSSVDGKIESELTKFDTGVLTPAIGAITKILLGVAGKSEATIKPLIEALMKPLGFLIKSEAEETTPEAHVETPEVTA